MSICLTFLCAVAGVDPNRPTFADAALSKCGPAGADAIGAALHRCSAVIRAPSPRCARTARAFALTAEVEPALRDLDYGAWRDRTTAEVAATDPYELSAFLTDPDAVPHGGESVRQLCQRVTNWLSDLPPQRGCAVVITEPAVARAAVVHALAVPVTAFWHITVPPLAMVTMGSQGGHWSVHRGPTPRGGPDRTAWDHLISA
ncbi:MULTISPECIES: histidine phosphatase family protein [unclassified Streptomyces]|uniref:histidine phosphatase family protein n=1 Tax=unclassified Streptomyces TaxID=2593676 RepID=UPI0035DC5D15